MKSTAKECVMKRSDIATTALLTILIVIGCIYPYGNRWQSEKQKGKLLAWQEMHHCTPVQDGTFHSDTGIVKKPIHSTESR
jgi:hypothetical protein